MASDTEAAVTGNQAEVLPINPDTEPQTCEAQSRAGHPRIDWRVLLATAVGGFVGGSARYGIGKAAPITHGGFPTATFAINVSGSFILALLMVFILEILPPTKYVRPLLGIGFCGAFTTFSTWMVDLDRLLAGGHVGTAAGYLFGSLAAGLAATTLGLAIGRAIVAHRRRRAPHDEPARQVVAVPDHSTAGAR